MRRARQTAEKIEGSAHRTGSLPTVVGNRTLAPPRERSRERGTDAVGAHSKALAGHGSPSFRHSDRHAGGSDSDGATDRSRPGIRLGPAPFEASPTLD